MIDGSGIESTLNGTGNLVLGYDEKPGTQTGSHNLLLGGTGNSYTSYGGIVGGFSNKISGALCLDPRRSRQHRLGIRKHDHRRLLQQSQRQLLHHQRRLFKPRGRRHTGHERFLHRSGSCGVFPSVLGGTGNQAGAENATVSGGEKNTASAIDTSVSGGYGNRATGRWDSVTGGYENIAGITEESNEFHGANSISGGAFNEATGTGQSWIGSGEYGIASGAHSALLGGYKGTVSATNATIGGGEPKASPRAKTRL